MASTDDLINAREVEELCHTRPAVTIISAAVPSDVLPRQHIDAVIDMLWVLARAVEIEKARAIKARVAADNAPRTFQNSSYRSSNGRLKDGMGGSAPDSAAAALLTKHSAALRLAVLEEHNSGFPITSLMGAGGDARPNRPFTPSSSPSSTNGEQVSATASLCGVAPSTNHSEAGTGTYARRVRAHFQELDAEIASGGAISKATMAEYHQLVMAQAQYETDHLSSGEMTAQIVEVAPRIVPLLRKGLANITPYQAFVLCRVLPVLRVDDLSLGLALVHKAMSKRRRHTLMLLPPLDPAAEQEALATGTSIVGDDDEDGNDGTVTHDRQVASIRETDGCDDANATASEPIEDQAMRADEGRGDDASMTATPSLSMPLPAAPRSGFYRAAARAVDPSAASIPIAGPRRGEGSLPVTSPLSSEQAELNDADGIHEPIVLKQPVQGELKAPSKKHDGSKTADPHHHQRSIAAEKGRQRTLEAGLLPDDSHALPRHSLYDVAVMTHALVSFGARDDALEGHLQEHALHAVGLEL